MKKALSLMVVALFIFTMSVPAFAAKNPIYSPVASIYYPDDEGGGRPGDRTTKPDGKDESGVTSGNTGRDGTTANNQGGKEDGSKSNKELNSELKRRSESRRQINGYTEPDKRNIVSDLSPYSPPMGVESSGDIVYVVGSLMILIAVAAFASTGKTKKQTN